MKYSCFEIVYISQVKYTFQIIYYSIIVCCSMSHRPYITHDDACMCTVHVTAKKIKSKKLIGNYTEAMMPWSTYCSQINQLRTTRENINSLMYFTMNVFTMNAKYNTSYYYYALLFLK